MPEAMVSALRPAALASAVSLFCASSTRSEASCLTSSPTLVSALRLMIEYYVSLAVTFSK